MPLALWYEKNAEDIPAFEKQMRRKVHSVHSPFSIINSPFSPHSPLASGLRTQRWLALVGEVFLGFCLIIRKSMPTLGAPAGPTCILDRDAKRGTERRGWAVQLEGEYPC